MRSRNCRGRAQFRHSAIRDSRGCGGSWDLILVDDDDRRHEVNLAAPGDTAKSGLWSAMDMLISARVLAAMWTRCMDAAATNA